MAHEHSNLRAEFHAAKRKPPVCSIEVDVEKDALRVGARVCAAAVVRAAAERRGVSAGHMLADLEHGADSATIPSEAPRPAALQPGL